MSDTVRVPPNAPEAERAVLGAIFLDNAAIHRVSLALVAADFYETRHRAIFGAMLATSVRGDRLDILTVGDELRTSQRLESVGGLAYLNGLLDCVPTAANVEHYAEQVRAASRLRAVIDVTSTACAEAYSQPGDVDEFVSRVEGSVFGLSRGSMQTRPESAADIAHEVFAQINRASESGEAPGVRTGIPELDEATGGMFPGEVIVLAGRPGMGKTALALGLARAVGLSTRKPPLYVSLEMARADLVRRQIAERSGIPTNRLRAGRIYPNEWVSLTSAASDVARVPMQIDDDRRSNVMRVLSLGRRQIASSGLSMIVIDYVQLMRPTTTYRDAREREVAEVSRDLRAIAKDLGVPILALAQLNRDLEKRAAKKPQLSDLRESGALEQDADGVWFVHRAAAYDDAAPADEAELCIRKNRNGPICDVPLVWVGARMAFAPRSSGPSNEHPHWQEGRSDAA